MNLAELLPPDVSMQEDRATYWYQAIEALQSVSYERKDLFLGMAHLAQQTRAEKPSLETLAQIDILLKSESFAATELSLREATTRKTYDNNLRGRLRGAQGRIRVFELVTLFQIFEGVITTDLHFNRESNAIEKLQHLATLADSLANEPFTLRKSLEETPTR